MPNLAPLTMSLTLAVLSASQTAHAFSVVTDESIFLLNYENPSEVVTFDSPSPGSLTGVSYSLGGGNSAYEVREEGWSRSIYIGSLRTDGCCWGATTWYGDYVSPSIYDRPQNWINRIYIALTGTASVLSLNTSNGFYGLIPTNSTDTFFSLPVDITLAEVALGYRQVSSVPEPTSAALFGVGVGVIFLRRRSSNPAPPSIAGRCTTKLHSAG